MKWFPSVLIGLLALVVMPSGHAAELLINTFLEGRPFKGVEVALDGEPVGETGAQGDVSATLTAGEHTLEFLKNSIPLADYTFSVAEGESAEVSVTFGDFFSDPEINIATYDASAPPAADGAPGTIAGEVLDGQGAPLTGAVVRVPETGDSAVTDGEGLFELSLPRGTYTLIAEREGFKTVEQSDFRVVANVGIAATIRLLPEVDSAEVEQPAEAPTNLGSVEDEMVVYGVFRAPDDAVGIEKFSTSITDAIDIDDLIRSGDSDVAAALRRLVGVSITDGRYAVVRGLDGRYVSATLNGSLMPGTDPFRRDVQLDLFPADILGGLEIQKNFSAELPGDTTGGVIKMTTRGMPDEYVNKLSFSLGFVDGVTGEDLGTYRGSDSDDLGFDDGLRDLPGPINAATDGGRDFNVCQIEGQANCVERDVAGQLATLLPNILNPGSESADPNFSIGYALGNRFEVDLGEMGLYGSLSYDRGSKARQNASIDDNSVRTDYTRDQRTTTVSGYFVAGLLPDDDTEYLSKTILLRNTEDTVEVESGINKDEGTGLDRALLEWEERQFISQQFEGNHDFFDGTQTLSWRAGLSQTRRDSPDRRSYLYINNSLALSTFERSYSELVEDGIDLGVDYRLPVTLTEGVDSTITLGALSNIRDREVDLLRIGTRRGSGPNVSLNQDPESLFTAENFLNDSFQLQQRTTDTDSYDGEQETFAVYVSTETNLGDAFTVLLGVRSDSSSQTLTFPNSPGSEAELDSDEVLPTLYLTYRYTDALQFRGGYASTVSRPNLTELSPSVFYDERGREFRGCPTCEASFIDNFDVRAEYYFDGEDSISVALFTKEIDDPLETALEDGSGSATSALTFRNAVSATVSGVEIDGNLTLVDGLEGPHLLVLGGNVSFIDSEVELDSLSQRLEANPMRELQGQSPFLANLRLSWDYAPWAQKFTLVANYFDDRIDRISRGQPAIEEAGRLIVSANYEKEIFTSSKISFRVKNLLNESVEYLQGGRVIERYDEGVEMSAGYSVNF